MKASLVTGGKLLPPPLIFLMHTFIHSLNKSLMNENDVPLDLFSECRK